MTVHRPMLLSYASTYLFRGIAHHEFHISVSYFDGIMLMFIISVRRIQFYTEYRWRHAKMHKSVKHRQSVAAPTPRSTRTCVIHFYKWLGTGAPWAELKN